MRPRAAADARATAPTPATAPRSRLPFVEDDFDRALAEARARKLPLFVDGWALWCHSCMSMRAYVFTDPALAPERDRFVWLSLDTEKEKNAPFVARYGVDALPTMWIFDPEAPDAPLWKYAGTLSAPELRAVLDGARARSPVLAEARDAGARGDVRAARIAYERAIAAAAPQGDARAIAVDELVALLSTKQDYDACSDVAARELPSLSGGIHRTNVLVGGAFCATESKEGSPGRERLRAFADALTKAVVDPNAAKVPDDRSGMYEVLVGARHALGEDDAARAAAADWSRFLDAEAARAPTPEARTVFDSHRLLAYIELGHPERALPMLERSERDFPTDFDPPARIARALVEAKRYDEAVVAARRALGKAYGGRKLRIWQSIADIEKARGDRVGEARALDEALAFAKTIELPKGYRELRDGLAARRARLGP